jgi:hypothetical protein
MSVGGLDGCDRSAHTRVRRRLCAGPLIESVLVSQCGCGCCAPELDAISPDGFEDGFVEKELVR